MTTHAVAQIRTTHEIAYAQRLTDHGIECYCPTVVVMSRPSGKRCLSRVTAPRFPSYIFVAFDGIDYIDPVYQDSRFNGFLRVAHMVATIDEKQIAALRAWEGCEVMPEPVRPRLSTGDLAKPLDGPFGGMEGEVRLGNEGQIWLCGHKFTMPVQFTDASALILLESSCIKAA